MAKADERRAQIEALTAEHYERIKAAGGAFSYITQYLHHVIDLRKKYEHVHIRERHTSYPRMAVQMAAVSAVIQSKDQDYDIDTKSNLLMMSRGAWIHSAGHYDDPSTNSGTSEVVEDLNPQAIAMIEKGASARRNKAQQDWDRLIETDVESLFSIAVRGHEFHKPLTKKERWQGYLALTAVVVVIIGYGVSHWILAANTSSDPNTDYGVTQRMKAIDRINNYEALMSSTARRAGFFKLILDWPMSPTKAEQNAFIDVGREIINLCNGVHNPDQVYDLVNKVRENINLQDKTIEPYTRLQSLILQAMKRHSPGMCR